MTSSPLLSLGVSIGLAAVALAYPATAAVTPTSPRPVLTSGPAIELAAAHGGGPHGGDVIFIPHGFHGGSHFGGFHPGGFNPGFARAPGVVRGPVVGSPGPAYVNEPTRMAGRDGDFGRFHRHDRDNRFGVFVSPGVLGDAYPYYDQDYAYTPDYTSDYSTYYDTEPTVVAPSTAGDEEFCRARYRSYDPASGTYLGYDGMRHPCP